ncbi:MAG: amidohydrolase family protein [Paracoccaceae bacterium]|nr:amidohydrolase family protein [Paracoccaceae bacterium]
MSSVLIRGGLIVSPRQSIRADILVRDGVIAAIGRNLPVSSAARTMDVGGLTVLPGVIDPHSHLWESGFMSDPDFADSTASAVAGGITTIIDMPLTVPEVLDAETFNEKARLGERTSHTDFALHAGVSPDNLHGLAAMWHEGCTAFKIFTCETGCPMAGLTNDYDLSEALRVIGSFNGLAAFHAENNDLLNGNLERIRRDNRTDNMAFVEWRNETVELEAINRILFLASRFGTRVNIVHVTSPAGVALVERAHADGVNATAETCPHYLYLTSEDIAVRGAWLSCAPPMRGQDARDGLRSLMADGSILTVGSDHGPVDPALKRRGSNNILDGQPGLPGNETMVPLLLNLAASGTFSLNRLAEVTAESPAILYGLFPRKGVIAVGSDADFTIVDPEYNWTIKAENLVGKSGWTPYEDLSVSGKVELSIIRGKVAAEDGRPVQEPGSAAFVRRH